MMLQRRNHFSPFGEFRQMQANMDRMRRRFGSFHHPGHNGFTGFEPWPAPLDVVADGDDFVVRASMPGVAPENIQVSIEDGVLTVRGETASHFETTEGNYLMRERRSGSFHRSLRLPDTVDAGQGGTPLRAWRPDHQPAQGRGQEGQAVRGEGRAQEGLKPQSKAASPEGGI